MTLVVVAGSAVSKSTRTETAVQPGLRQVGEQVELRRQQALLQLTVLKPGFSIAYLFFFNLKC